MDWRSEKIYRKSTDGGMKRQASGAGETSGDEHIVARKLFDDIGTEGLFRLVDNES